MGSLRKKLEIERTKGIITSSFRLQGLASTDSFVDGFNCGVDTTLKVLKDKRNKYNAWLSEEVRIKLDKIVNIEKIKACKAHIWILNELIKDFENGK